MPVDNAKFRKAIEHNDDTHTKITGMSDNLKKVDARNFEGTSATAKEWSGNIKELKVSLKEQSEISKSMREAAVLQEEQTNEGSRKNYGFLCERLKADARYFFHALQEFVDLPKDFGNPQAQKSWEHCAHDMENSLKAAMAITSSDPGNPTPLEPLVALLNYRDSVLALLLKGLLFQIAVLHWDMHSNRGWADGPMVEMFELVVNMVSKTETVHHKLESMPPSVNDHGVFTYKPPAEKQEKDTATNELSPLQSRLLTLLREVQTLDSGLRNMKFGQQVTIPDDGATDKTKTVAADALRAEITKWHQKCMKLESELQASKAQRHAPLEQQVEILTAKVEEKEKLYRQQAQLRNRAESEATNKVHTINDLRREKELLQKENNRFMKEERPKLDKIDEVLAKSAEAVDRLNADAELLSSMFQLQVQENKKNVAERNEISQELSKVHQQLKRERLKSQFKEDELQKKETLYLRTMAARKSIHESYLEQKEKILEVEEKQRKRESDWQEMLKILEGKDSDVRQLKADLRRATQRIDELEQQKKTVLEEFKKATGRSCNALLEGFKPSPTVLPSDFDDDPAGN